MCIRHGENQTRFMFVLSCVCLCVSVCLGKDPRQESYSPNTGFSDSMEPLSDAQPRRSRVGKPGQKFIFVHISVRSMLGSLTYIRLCASLDARNHRKSKEIYLRG